MKETIASMVKILIRLDIPFRLVRFDSNDLCKVFLSTFFYPSIITYKLVNITYINSVNSVKFSWNMT